MSDYRMPREVADLLLRQEVALAQQGCISASYDLGRTDNVKDYDQEILLTAVRVIGVENVLDPDLSDLVETVRREARS